MGSKQVLLTCSCFDGGLPIPSAPGGSVQIALFLRNILFVLGSSQASNVGGVCCVINLEPQSRCCLLRCLCEASLKPVGDFRVERRNVLTPVWTDG